MIIGNKNFEFGKKTYVMGILNVTPDSFSDGGNHNSTEKAITHAKKMVEQGADIIDIGGESTAMNAPRISEEEELRRVIPVIEKITEKFDIAISIDTVKSSVAEAALERGASIVNDFSGLISSEMSKICAKHKAIYIITRSYNKKYKSENFLKNCVKTLENDIKIALENDVKKENIIIDPALGFFNGYEKNFEIINNLEIFLKLGFPVLIGASRKIFFNNLLGGKVSPIERESPNLAVTTIAALKGCNCVRVHDVKKNKDALLAVEMILKQRKLT